MWGEFWLSQQEGALSYFSSGCEKAPNQQIQENKVDFGLQLKGSLQQKVMASGMWGEWLYYSTVNK